MKEIYRNNEANIKDGYDLIFIIRRNVTDISFKDLESAFKHIIKISKMEKK